MWTTTQQGEIRVRPQEFDAFLFSDWWLSRHVPDELRPAVFAKGIGRVTSHHFDYLGAEVRLADACLPRFKVLAASSERLQRRVADVYCARPCLRLRTPVDLDYFYPQQLPPRENPAFTVGWCGRRPDGILDFKGHGTVLLCVVALLAQECPEIQVEVLDATYRSPHFVTDMRQFYGKLDVLLSTSWLEGDPLPVLEAMACGIPVVATDAGIVPELTAGGAGAWLVRGATQAERVEGCLEGIRACRDAGDWEGRSYAVRGVVASAWAPEVIRAEMMEALRLVAA